MLLHLSNWNGVLGGQTLFPSVFLCSCQPSSVLKAWVQWVRVVDVVVLGANEHLTAGHSLLISFDDRTIRAVVERCKKSTIRCHVEFVSTVLRSIIIWASVWVSRDRIGLWALWFIFTLLFGLFFVFFPFSFVRVFLLLRCLILVLALLRTFLRGWLCILSVYLLHLLVSLENHVETVLLPILNCPLRLIRWRVNDVVNDVELWFGCLHFRGRHVIRVGNTCLPGFIVDWFYALVSTTSRSTSRDFSATLLVENSHSTLFSLSAIVEAFWLIERLVDKINIEDCRALEICIRRHRSIC